MQWHFKLALIRFIKSTLLKGLYLVLAINLVLVNVFTVVAKAIFVAGGDLTTDFLKCVA